MRKAKGVVVGGSIAGLTCAHALISAGWDVLVLEKACEPPAGSLAGCPTGAGLGLEPQACQFLQTWLVQPSILNEATFPLSIDQNQGTDHEKKSRVLTRDEDFNFRGAHWGDLHGLLYRALPSETVLWGHQFLSFQTSQDNATVRVEVRVLQTDQVFEITGDLLVAADGCHSTIRRHFLPDLKLRYVGYCAWRGVLDFSDNESSNTILGIHKAYPELGHCLYFDLAEATHCILFELPNKRINWVWFVNQPEPELKRNSMTMKVSHDLIEKMHIEAEKVWVPELARVLKETKDPFVNVIYDCDPLDRLAWDNVLLVGDAAHPTSPHGSRSTNMAILDAGVLGRCLEKWGPANLGLALKEFESIRLPVISKQVLHSRRMGRIKQGLVLDDNRSFDWKMASPEDCKELFQRSMPFFGQVPT